MKKDFLKLLIFGFAGGIAGAFFFIFLTGNLFGNILMASDRDSSVPVQSAAVSPSVAPGAQQRVLAEFSPRIAAIQVFKDNKLVRQGSGIIVSSDGLVITVADLAVAQGAYQVFYEDKIARGIVSVFDRDANLVLIKTDASQSSVTDLGHIEYDVGEEIIIAGKIVSFAKPALLSQRGSISYVSGRTVIVDSTFGNTLAGTATIDLEGNLVGINYLRNSKINLIGADKIAGFLQKYLNK